MKIIGDKSDGKTGLIIKTADLAKSDVGIKCPLCDTENPTYKHSFDLEICAKNIVDNDVKSLSEMETYLRENIFHCDLVNIFSCEKCELDFASPFVSGDSLIYNKVYSESQINKRFWKWDFEEALKEVSREHLGGDEAAGLKILDIGAGSGHFLKRIKSSFGNAECYAVEYSNSCRAELEKIGVHCFTDLSSLCDAGLVEFDFITIFQVVEHVDNFDEFFGSIRGLLARGGKIIISTPNAVQRASYDSVGVYEDVPPIHLSRFTEATFLKIANKYSLRLLKFESQSGNFLRNLYRFLLVKFKRNKVLCYLNSQLGGKYLRLLLLTLLALYAARDLLKVSRRTPGVSQLVIYATR